MLENYTKKALQCKAFSFTIAKGGMKSETFQ